MSDVYERMAADNLRLLARHEELDAEVQRLRAELNLRDPLDAMDRGLSPVEAAVTHVWGERCSGYEPACQCCIAWEEFDQIAALRGEVERLRAVLRNITRQCNNPIHTSPPGMERIIERVEEMAIDALGPQPNALAGAAKQEDDK